MQLGRTKCTGISTNLISPFFQEQLAKRLIGVKFSLLIDGEEVVSLLELLLKSVCSRYMDPGGKPKTLSFVDFGTEFADETSTFLMKCKDKAAAQKGIVEVQKCCLILLKESVAQLEKRVPENLALFRNFTGLQPKKVLNQATRVPFSSRPLIKIRGPRQRGS